jgi:hypothetical protein
MKFSEFVEIVRDLAQDPTIPTSKISMYAKFNYPFILSLLRLTNRSLTIKNITFTTNQNPYTLPPQLLASTNFIVKALYIYYSPMTIVKLERVDYTNLLPIYYYSPPSKYAVYEDKIYFDTILPNTYTFILEYVPTSFDKSVGAYEPTEDDLNIGRDSDTFSNDATLPIPDEFIYPYALKIAISLSKDPNVVNKLTPELQSAISSVMALGGKQDPERYVKPFVDLRGIK